MLERGAKLEVEGPSGEAFDCTYQETCSDWEPAKAVADLYDVAFIAIDDEGQRVAVHGYNMSGIVQVAA